MTLAIAGQDIHRLLVLGLGVTGRAVVEYCKHHGIDVAVSEARPLTAKERSWLAEIEVPSEENGHSERFLARSDAVVLSPGVPADHQAVIAAWAAGKLVLSELDLAFSQLGAIPVIAVTGTNGKGTTATLIDRMLQLAGRRPCLGGNIGTPFISLLDETRNCDVIVLEASSFQLEQSQLIRPRVGTLLNLTPDHLCRHKTMTAYAEAKGRLFRQQRREDTAVLPRALASSFKQGQGRRVFFDAPPPALPEGSDGLSPHDRANLAAALSSISALDPILGTRPITLNAILDAFAAPHRMQNVGTVGDVRIINDSKSTNADSAVAALRSVAAPTILLLGGQHKGAGYETLAREVALQNVRRVILFGEAADDLAVLFDRASVKTIRTKQLTTALEIGLSEAYTGDVLLFSPACSSFDAFENYVKRGEAFLQAVRTNPRFSPFDDKDVHP